LGSESGLVPSAISGFSASHLSARGNFGMVDLFLDTVFVSYDVVSGEESDAIILRREVIFSFLLLRFVVQKFHLLILLEIRTRSLDRVLFSF
jgi:hypothetical protein